MAAVEKILLQFEADIKDLKSELAKVKGQLGGVEKQSQTAGSKMTNIFKNVGKAIAGAFAIQQVTRFIGEVDMLARKAEGVEKAFANIGDSRSLDQLRTATKGTVSDLQLMQNAVKASNFQIPLDQLGKLFAFAQQRARETGESVDYLVDSIVLGIGRKSPLILDNLGISAVRLRSEFKGLGVETAEVGDVAAAVGRIIDEEMTKAGDTTTEAADAADQLTASIENLKLELGKELSPALTESRKALEWFLGVAVQGAQILTASVMGVENYAVMVGERLSTEAARGAKAMENFNKFFTENKSQFKSSKEAAEAYVEVLAKQIRVYNRRMATEEVGQDLMKIERDLLAQNINTIENYIKTLSGEGGFNDALDDLNEKVLDLSESLDVLPKILSDIYDPLSELPDETERWRAALSRLLGDVENNDGIADFYDNLEKSIKSADDANIKFFESIEDNNDVIDNSILYARQLSDAMGMLQGSISDIAGEQGKFTNFLQSLSIAQILFSRSVAIANAVEAGSLSLKQPGGLLKFLATTTFIIAQITGFIGDSLKTVRSQQVPAYADGVVDLKGAGTERSDSIVARLSKGESVITAKGTRQDKGLFEAANKLELEKYINANYILPALKEKQKSEGAMFDDYRLYLTMIKGQNQDKELNKKLVKVLGQRVNKNNNWA